MQQAYASAIVAMDFISHNHYFHLLPLRWKSENTEYLQGLSLMTFLKEKLQPTRLSCKRNVHYNIAGSVYFVGNELKP